MCRKRPLKAVPNLPQGGQTKHRIRIDTTLAIDRRDRMHQTLAKRQSLPDPLRPGYKRPSQCPSRCYIDRAARAVLSGLPPHHQIVGVLVSISL